MWIEILFLNKERDNFISSLISRERKKALTQNLFKLVYLKVTRLKKITNLSKQKGILSHFNHPPPKLLHLCLPLYLILECSVNPVQKKAVRQTKASI